MTVEDIVATIAMVGTHYPKSIYLVVVTGGEPFRQNCHPLVRVLERNNYTVQIETNGMVDAAGWDERYPQATIVCSPKGSVHKDMRRKIDVLKYVLKADMIDPADGLPTRALDLLLRPERPWPGFAGTVYVQPCDEGDPERNRANLAAAVQSCMQFGYTLGIQIHKLAELP
jgi:organic radical activating enzyme